MKVLAGDVGGTNARLALVTLDGDGARIIRAHTYPSQQFSGLGMIARRFLADIDVPPVCARYAVAGPVENGKAHLPNLDWDIEADALADETGIAETKLLNDFSAIGYAIPILGGADLVELQAKRTTPDATIAILGPGTGLGQGFLVWTGKAYRVCASEGGHSDFAATNKLQCMLHAWLCERYGHASWERVLCGTGLANIYRFLADSGFRHEDPIVHAEMMENDPPAVVSRHGLAGDDPLCVKALSIFVAALGAQAGNLALTLNAGAVYLAGGIAPKILAALQGPDFLHAFHDKGRFRQLLETIAVRVIINPQVGLIGAAASARTN
jgi:glucokinase